MKQRNTIQRKLLMKTVKSLKSHPTAEEVFKAVSKEHPQISLATVYRNLNLMAKNGEIGKIPVGDAAYRFDSGATPHYHIRCLKCGKFYDVEAEYCHEIDRMIEERTGFAISGHSLLFEGICTDCSGEETARDSAEKEGHKA